MSAAAARVKIRHVSWLRTTAEGGLCPRGSWEPCFSENTVKGMKMHMNVHLSWFRLCVRVLEVMSQSCVRGKIHLRVTVS